MAKFFFNESAVMELITENGRAAGGAAVQTLVWMEGLHELGHEVLLAKSKNDNRTIKPEFRKFTLVDLFDNSKGIKKIRWASYRFPKFFQALKKTKPDFLYESVPSWNSYVTALFCRSLGIKHIIRISNDNLLDKRLLNTASKSHQFFLYLGLKWSHFILTQNDFQFQTLKKKYPQKPIFKIFNPIKINQSILLPKENMTGYFAWIAYFRFQKNLKLLYLIAKILPDEKFKIAGLPTSHFDIETKSYVKKLEKLSNVEFVGKVEREHILPFLKKAKYLLNTSRYEGFSNTFLEAMNCGTPILTTTAVNPDNIISKHELGFAYEDENELKNLLMHLSFDKYSTFSKNCIQYLNENHNHQILSQKLYAFLTEK